MRIILDNPVEGCKSCTAHDILIIKDGKDRLAQIRALPARHWHGDTQSWHVPYVTVNWEALLRAKFPISKLPAPEATGYSLETRPMDPNKPEGRKLLLLKTLGTPEDIQRAKQIPEHRVFSSKEQGWLIKPSRTNVQYLLSAFTAARWDDEAYKAVQHFEGKQRQDQVQAAQGRQAGDPLAELPGDFEFTGTPFTHQIKAFNLGRNKIAFAAFMEMGTGKTYVDIQDSIDWLRQGKLEAWLIVCPNSVKSNWVEELEKFVPPSVGTDVFVWEARTRHKAERWVLQANIGRPFRCLIMNVEAFSSKIGASLAELFLSKYTCKMTVDESSRIKSHSAARTRKIMALGKKALVRRILTGTPVTQSPLDLYTQMRFLDPLILGYSSYFTFRNRYAIMGGWEGRQVVGFSNMDELKAKVEPYSFRVLKADCLDLPPKVYVKQSVMLTDTQRQMYDQMKDEMVAEMGGQKVTVQHAIVQLQLLQRIVGGFLPIRELVGNPDDPEIETRLERIPGGNPKLDELLDIAADTPKLIIWARFRAELALIADSLRQAHGSNSVREFHGGVTTDARTEARRSFQDNTSEVRFLVAQPQAGGIGLTLTAASTVVYYSNDFSLETRQQSEDRAHRIGQSKKVTYIDLVAKGTLDTRLLAALRSKKSMADLITGDPSLQWL